MIDAPCRTREALRRAAPWLILALAAGGHIALRGTFGRPFHVDELFYKAAGLHWALGEGFRAPEEAGFMGLDPGLETIWAAQPPLYPFLFGVVVKLAGLGWRQSVLYDAAIHAVFAFLTALVVRRQAPQLPKWVAPIAGLALLPLGMSGRPDELATCLGMAAFLLLPVSPPTLWRFVGAGVLMGLCAGASLGAAAVLSLIVLAAILVADWPATRKIAALTLIAALGLLSFAAVVAPLALAQPEAVRQYVNHLHDNFTSTPWMEGMLFSLEIGRSQFVMLLIWAFVGLATFVTLYRARRWKGWLHLWAGPLCGVTFLFLCRSDKFYYYWFLAPWLLAAVLATVAWLPESPLRLTVVTMAGGIYLASLTCALQDEAMLATLPPGQRIEDGGDTARRLVPPGARVWCNSVWWALAEDRVVFDLWLDLNDLQSIDYVVVPGTGWGAPDATNLINPARRDLIEGNFDLISDGFVQRAGLLPTHHGTVVPDEGYGFGVRVYRARRLH